MQTSDGTRDQSAGGPYRIDFALIVLTGNLTRYQIVRPQVERDTSVVANWFPIRTWFAEDPLRVLPGFLRIRARHLVDAWGLFSKQPPEATVIHALDTYPLYAAYKKFLKRDVLIVSNPDAALKIGWPTSFAVKNTDLFVMWSRWGAEEMREHYPEVPADKIVVIHPGINIADWPMRPLRRAGERFRLLFVGGDYSRKGGDTLVTAFARHLSETCELDLATHSGYLPPAERERIARTPNVRLHLDLKPGSPELKALFRDCDCFVLPTNWDCSPWVAIESLCSGLPIVTTDVGGIPDIVEDGRTGLLVKPGDPAAIAQAVNRLREAPELVETLIRNGRKHVETHFDAEKNTQRFLSTVKRLIDERRSEARASDLNRSHQFSA